MREKVPLPETLHDSLVNCSDLSVYVANTKNVASFSFLSGAEKNIGRTAVTPISSIKGIQDLSNIH